MKKRQKDKILKRAGVKLHNKMGLSPVEKRVCDKVADSKLCSALDKFRMAEFNAGTIYEDGYIERLKEVVKVTSTIENITGVST